MDVESSTLTYSIVDDSLYRDKNTERGSHFCRGIWILREPLGEDGNSGGCFAGLLELGSQKFALGRGVFTCQDQRVHMLSAAGVPSRGYVYLVDEFLIDR